MSVEIESVPEDEAPLFVSWEAEVWNRTETGHYQSEFYIPGHRPDVTPEREDTVELPSHRHAGGERLLQAVG